MTNSVLPAIIGFNVYKLPFTQYASFLESLHQAHATRIAYQKDIEQLSKFVASRGKYFPHEVTKEDIEAFLASLSEQGYVAKSLARKMNAVHSFFRFLVKNGYVSSDPALQVSPPKYEIGVPRILSPMEYRALRDTPRRDPRVSAIIEVLLQTGIRIGELANLDLDDITPEGLRIQAYEKHAEKVVPLNASARAALESYLHTRPSSLEQKIFITRSGHPFLIRNMRTAIERYFHLAGISNATVNDLRNTFIAQQLRSGISIDQLAKLMGYKRLSSAERFLKHATVPGRAKTGIVAL